MPPHQDPSIRLVADIGGTHARFALSGGPGQWSRLMVLTTEAWPDPRAAIEHYLASMDSPPPAGACLAIAAPLRGDHIAMVNASWSFSRAELARHFHWPRLQIINDLAAVAVTLPHLQPDDLLALGTTPAPADTEPLPRAVLAPGTGFGTALLLPTSGGWQPIPAEGGHALLGSNRLQELAVIDYWLRRGLAPTRENLLSGPGMYRLYQACCALHDRPRQAADGVEVTALAQQQADPMAVQALALYLSLLGSSCGDLALSTGAWGGLWLAGGVLPKISQALIDSSFRARLEDKGPMTDLMRATPTHLILADQPGLTGAAHQAWADVPP